MYDKCAVDEKWSFESYSGERAVEKSGSPYGWGGLFEERRERLYCDVHVGNLYRC